MINPRTMIDPKDINRAYIILSVDRDGTIKVHKNRRASSPIRERFDPTHALEDFVTLLKPDDRIRLALILDRGET